jgi:hypothetical protein
LEVTVKTFRFRRNRVYIVDSPEEWAERINELIETNRGHSN